MTIRRINFTLSPDMKDASLGIPLLLAAASCALFSCGGSASPDLERVSLFEIPYGRFDGEIDLFSNVAGQTGGVCPEACLYMREGIFYVGNAASKKVMQFTSYGDLLALYYNPEFVPPPAFRSSPAARDGRHGTGQGGDHAEVMTQRAIEYPFNMISAVAADSRRRLYVADMLPEERVEYSEDDELMLCNIVVRFDAQGGFIDYLGQEGPGGTPFSAISGIYAGADDELFVASLRQGGADVFWFSAAGRLLYKIPVLADALPSPYGDGRKAISALSAVLPARRRGALYLAVDYYRVETDSETGSQSGIVFDRTELYPFYIERAAFGEPVSLPAYEGEEAAAQGGQASARPYGVIGADEGERLFLYAPTQRGYEICIVNLNSGRIQRRALAVGMDEQAYNVFHLSDGGILSALLAGPDGAKIVWWRTDAL